MFLQIEPNSPPDLEVHETTTGTYVRSRTHRLSPDSVSVEPMKGVTIFGTTDSCKNSNSNNSNAIFVPCKFKQLRMNCNEHRVRLRGITDENYQVFVCGERNYVVFGDNRNLGCVSWEELGALNTLDVSQQNNTYTRGTFSPTTNVLTKKPYLPYCTICSDESPSNALLLPCRHIAMCIQCCEASFSISPVCPFCKANVESVQKLYAV